jgi:hypothetical protein
MARRLTSSGIDNLVGEFAADNEGVTDDIPLTIRTVEAQKFPEVMNETGHLHPVWLSVSTHSLGGLCGTRKVSALIPKGTRELNLTCNKCWIWDNDVSGSDSSTSVSNFSIASQIVILALFSLWNFSRAFKL